MYRTARRKRALLLTEDNETSEQIKLTMRGEFACDRLKSKRMYLRVWILMIYHHGWTTNSIMA